MSEPRKNAEPSAAPRPDPRDRRLGRAARPDDTEQPPAKTTYAPRDRVPQADAEEEC